MCINVLSSIAKQPKCAPSVRVNAAVALLDRGWGKPAQVISGDPDHPIEHIVRRIVDGDEAKVIEHIPNDSAIVEPVVEQKDARPTPDSTTE